MDDDLSADVLGDLPASPRPAPRVPKANWRKDLRCNKRGDPYSHLANAILALRQAPEWRGVLNYDAFATTTHANGAPPWQAGCNDWKPRAWTGLDDMRTAEWMQQHGLLVTPLIAGQAVQVVASDSEFHPVRDYLTGLRWDAKERVDTWLSSYLGVEEKPYVRAIGAMALVAAVARILAPGCKADHVPIIEGSQGTGKSSALRILGGDWFTDEIADLGSKDAAMQTRGAWLIEIAELDSMSRAEVSKVKAFISRTTDRFRPPYGSRIIESPRECVFWGTTNKSTYLGDETGARRFWPIRAGCIDLDSLDRDRDQLWAEAKARYDDGDRWWLTGDILADAAEQQAERYIEDPWHHLVAEHVASLSEVSVTDILGNMLNIDRSKWTQPDHNRIARILISMGWERRQFRTKTFSDYTARETGDKREWKYCKKR